MIPYSLQGLYVWIDIANGKYKKGKEIKDGG
jgi:hypothetical protein